MRKIRQVLEYRLSKNISAEQTSLALSLSKGSVINYLERFQHNQLQQKNAESRIADVKDNKVRITSRTVEVATR